MSIIKFHKEGLRIISTTLIICMIILTISWILFPVIFFLSVLFLTLIFLILLLRFFRVPKRNFILKPDSILAPADGKVVAIEQIIETEYLKKNCTLISIFMSIHNVHINYYPSSGVISYYNYYEGKYLVARHPKSSELNERSTIAIKNNNGEILLSQIAGYVARRIVSYAVKGRKVKQSDELGFIKFGSRLDIYIPENAEIKVKLGTRTIGGVTEIADLR